jgi:mRNA interferase RelE/StbE
MSYQIIIPKTVTKQLEKLPQSIHNKIIENIIILQENPRPTNSLKMKNNEGYRLKIGDYRVLYDIDDKTLLITLRRVGHRREIYR